MNIVTFHCQFTFREALPGHWDIDLDQFQKILVLKALRLDKVGNAMQDYVASCLGQQFIEPQVRCTNNAHWHYFSVSGHNLFLFY